VNYKKNPYRGKRKNDLTVSIQPDEDIETTMGVKSGRDWVADEVRRINSDPARCVSVEERHTSNGAKDRSLVIVVQSLDKYYVKG